MHDTFSLKRFQGGDKFVFKHIFDSYYKGLVLYAFKYIEDMHIAEDIAQESFLALWNKRADIREVSSIKAFLYISIKNRCLNYIRNQRIRNEHYANYLEESGEDVFYDTSLIEAESWRLLMNALDQMSEQTRRICLMSIEGFKNMEIAEKLNISVSSVKYHRTQAKNSLAVAFKDYL